MEPRTVHPNLHLSSRPTLRAVAVSAFLVFGLAACGGGSTEVAVEAPERAGSTEFLTGSETAAEAPEEVEETEEAPIETAEDTPPEALAEIADDESPIGADSPPSPPETEGNFGVLSNGQIFLRGVVPSEEIADLTVTAFEAVLGEGNAVAEYHIDPTAEFSEEDDLSVYLAEDVLFETGSSQVSEEFDSVLDFGPTLLQVQPEATLWVFGHTDSDGDDDANLTLSEERVEAVRDWIVERGGDNDRIFTTGEGETVPVADNSTEEGRALNRRVEFILAGFDIGL